MINSKIQEVIDNFDFAKVQKVMSFLNWEWAIDGSIGNMAVPSVQKLITRAYIMLESLDDPEFPDKKHLITETGGFRASKIGEEYKLEFILEESCN